MATTDPTQLEIFAFLDPNWHLIRSPGAMHHVNNRSGAPILVAFTLTNQLPVDATDRVYEIGGMTNEITTDLDKYTWVRSLTGGGAVTIRPYGVVDPLEDITVVAQSASDAHQRITAHLGDRGNPHGVTKEQVGLGNLPNATTNATTDPDPNKLATALAVYQVQADIDWHQADLNNPHQVTKAQVGLGVVANYPPASDLQALDVNNNVVYMTPHTTAVLIDDLVQASVGMAPQQVIEGLIAARLSGWSYQDCSSPPAHLVQKNSSVVTVKAGLRVSFADSGKTRLSGKLTADVDLGIPLGTDRPLYIYTDLDVKGGFASFGVTANKPKTGTSRDGHPYDFFCVTDNTMYAGDGVTKLRRVYLGRVIVLGGAIYTVIPVPIGDSYIMPMNQTVELGGRYLLDNPFLEDFETYAEVYFSSAWGDSHWNDQIGVVAERYPYKPDELIILQCGQMGFLACGRESGSGFGAAFAAITSPLRVRICLFKKHR